MWLIAVFICLGWILSLCLHEFGHALLAYWGGDTSVKDKGYLTLNPLKYTEPSLSLVIPLFFLLIGSIALPGGAVYINQNRLRDRKWKSAVSAAGPIANVILACLLALPFQLGWYSLRLQSQNSVLFLFIISLAYIISLNTYIVLINLLPIPGLDGYGIIEPWLPKPIQQQFNKFRKYGILVLIGLLWFARPFNRFLWNFTNEINQFLGVPLDLAFIAGRIFSQSSQYLVIGIILLLWIFRDKNQDLQRQGDQLFSSQKYEQAITCYNKIVKKQPKNADAWYWRGYALYFLNKHEEAIASFDQAIQIQPDYAKAWFRRGYSLYCLQRYAEAITAYEKALLIKSDDSEIWYYQGIVLKDLEKYEEALAAYDQAIAIQSDFYQAWSNQAEILALLQRYDRAIAVYDKVIAIRPDDSNTWWLRGKALGIQQDYQAAVDSYERAIAIYSDFYGFWLDRGNALYYLHRYEDAIASYDKVIQLKSDNTDAWNYKGVALMELQRYEEALVVYNKAIEIKSDYPDYWYNKACCYALQSNVALATKNLQKSIKCEPDRFWELAKTDPDFDGIREHPLFKGLVDNVFDERFKAQYISKEDS
ncbi:MULTISPECIES: tetratricopeptide repeat protein [unclassified Nostoc]|uniref:tetratricopeptide repeat protein n=1 Tax=unclassified Nostoc TaxID=2593658 RepID=UPI002AD54B52|nr:MULTISPECIES: tetratricopeptide repeat protein [unclassified Nostoc]MDZ8126656.1 tetratricopeptide repeat protein [Nostoc sp. CmiVER01]MDZ8227880.1 tetratricopeptide repeat protein [Nostoc sp. ChiVER01]